MQLILLHHLVLLLLQLQLWQLSSASSNGNFRQGPAVSCTDSKKKILCLPKEYSKFDLPYRDDFNVIDIGGFP